MYLQHVTPSGHWQTLLTLINPNESDNMVIVHPARNDGDETADMHIVLDPFEKRVVDVSPDFGAPKQEIFVDKIAEQLKAPVVVAIGAAFDFHAGTVKQAPDWMQDHGLEWLYRLIQEPKRLWFRYCYYNPLFVIKYLWEKTKGRRAESN